LSIIRTKGLAGLKRGGWSIVPVVGTLIGATQGFVGPLVINDEPNRNNEAAGEKQVKAVFWTGRT
jgi:hypothetical protein